MKSQRIYFLSVVLVFMALVFSTQADTHYVDATNTTPVYPYTNWLAAATNIQDALNAAVDGETVLVTNGVYDTGKWLRPVAQAPATSYNRVVMANDVALQSVNGPEVTLIVGEEDPLGGLGSNAVRCVYMANGSISGFTLTNGYTRASDATNRDRSGGGINLQDHREGVVSNCVIVGNFAHLRSGGAHRGVLVDCIVKDNYSATDGGGVWRTDLTDCVVQGNVAGESGGGGRESTMTRCILRDNIAGVHGGGLYDGGLTNCVVEANRAGNYGGGAYSCFAYNSAFKNNEAVTGGGVAYGFLYNCTVVNNTAFGWAGGMFEGGAYNSIIWGNEAEEHDNVSGVNMHYSCTTPFQSGYENIDLDPQLVDGIHIASGSPCIDAGSTNYVGLSISNFIASVDIDGESWENNPSMGCDKVVAGSLVGPLSVSIDASGISAVEGTTLSFSAEIDGFASSNRWTYAGNEVWNQSGISHTWSTAGVYDVELRAYNQDWLAGVASTVTVTIVDSASVSTHYADAANGTSSWPYDSWATAATNIQDAVDAATASGMIGAKVWVTNGVYDTGTHFTPGYASENRVVIAAEINVESVNGPENTFIVGSEATLGGNGPGSVRCVYMSQGSLSGFTLTGGHTLTNDASVAFDQSGGGLNAASSLNVTISNCVVTGNSAESNGGGVYHGTVYDSVVSSNTAGYFGGGLYDCVAAYDSTIANNFAPYVGGTYYTDLTDCLVISNSATGSAGGVREGIVRTSTIAFNSSGGEGGGAYGGIFYNCTISGNTAVSGGGASRGLGVFLFGCVVTDNYASSQGGGVYDGVVVHSTVVRNSTDGSGGGLKDCSVQKSIVWANQASLLESNLDGCTVEYSCSTPLPSGIGNIDSNPQLVSAGHIAGASPCIGAAKNEALSYTDLDGEAWLSPPSMGCDEVVAGNLTGALSVVVSGVVTQVLEGATLSFDGWVDGLASSNVWSFGDGAEELNAIVAEHAWGTAGTYDVEFRAYNNSWPLGVASTVTVTVLDLALEGTHYVDAGSATPSSPYTSWATAATNIQAAVNVAALGMPGSRVLVTNGVYASGESTTPGYLSQNRIVITNDINVVSVNGPEQTFIVGAESTGGGVGSNAVRCVYMNNGLLSGFTLTNGFTRASGDANYDCSGGGVNQYPGLAGMMTNCVIVGCTAAKHGGGVFNGTLYDCTISDNSAIVNGGGVYGGSIYASLIAGNEGVQGGGLTLCEIYNCTVSNNVAQFGGGAYNCQVVDSLIVTNQAADGGGVYDGVVNDCVITRNHATDDGGGAAKGTLYDCTLSQNTAAGDGGGAYSCYTMHRCIFEGNTAVGYGGGARTCIIDTSTFVSNSATYGGGQASGTTTNSLFYANHATLQGGGVWRADLVNCTVVDNASDGEHGGVSMLSYSTMNNSIVYYNSAPVDADIDLTGIISNSCLSVDLGGMGNITNAPAFENRGASNYRLSVLSPCINVGDNAAVAGSVDRDGNVRIYDSIVDMGCYETSDDGSDADIDRLTDYAEGVTHGSNPNLADTDRDGTDDGDELFVGTDLLDPSSFFGVTLSGDTLSWPYKTDRQYEVEGRTNLVDGGWFWIGTNTSSNYVDTVKYDQIFYRVKVSAGVL